MRSLYQLVSLWVVGHSLQSLNVKDLTQFLNNAAGKTSTSVTQEPGRGSKDRDIASIQKFSDGFHSLIEGHICQYMFREMVLENQDIGNSGWFVQLHHSLYTHKVNV